MNQIGIYFLIDNDEIIYIGQTRNFEQRLKNHKASKKFTSFRFIECKAELLNSYEGRWLRKFRPRLNKSIPSGEKHILRLLRLPKKLDAKLKARAKRNKRSVNSQIVFELEYNQPIFERTFKTPA